MVIRSSISQIPSNILEILQQNSSLKHFDVVLRTEKV